MAKLNRESKLRDKRLEKQARKAARKLTAVGDAAERVSQADSPGRAYAGLEAGGRSDAQPQAVAALSEAAGGIR
jgi:hypothetical protein